MENIRSVFITGISGYVGGTIAVKLQALGYQISGLVRRPEQVAILEAAGMTPILGDLNNREAVSAGIRSCDAVIHASECDSVSIADFLIDELRGTGKTFIYTSGCAVLANWAHPEFGDFVYTEDYPVQAREFFPDRPAINAAVVRSAVDNIRSIVMIPGMVYGRGLFITKQSKQIPYLTEDARVRGRAAYIGSGEAKWGQVHVEDLADLYVAALAKAKAGSVFIAENGEASFKAIATAIQHQLQLPGEPVSLTKQQAIDCWGTLSANVGLGSYCRLNADKARLFLGWQPKYHSFADFID